MVASQIVVVAGIVVRAVEQVGGRDADRPRLRADTEQTMVVVILPVRDPGEESYCKRKKTNSLSKIYSKFGIF